MELRKYTERALRRVSPIYDKSEFMQGLYNGAGASFDLLREYCQALRDQSFIDLVTWGIDYQERKYSLEVRRDLTLAQRRARLGIKARRHYPLNPGIIEKHLKDAFNFACYLYEGVGGLLKVYYRYATAESYLESIAWLQEEKPAHLELGTVWSWAEYIGGGGAKDDAIHTPDSPVVIPGEGYPRVFAGVAELAGGSVEVGLSRPSNQLMRVFAGVGLWVSGGIWIGTESLGQKWIRESGVAELAIAEGGLAR